MSDRVLRNRLIRLASENPALRPHLLPLLADKEAGFSRPDPRNLAKQFAQIKSELADLEMWSKTLGVGLTAVKGQFPVEGPLRDLMKAQADMRQSVAVLAPLVEAYYQSQLPPTPRHIDPRTL